jgi:hypothetical protein
MKLGEEKRGFALSSMALLLMLPALLLVASGLKMIESGGETSSIQILADKVNSAGKNIAETIKLMQERKFPITDNTLQSLAEKYRLTTGLIIEITTGNDYPLWIRVKNTGVNHYPGTKYCTVEKISPDEWKYSFEDSDAEIGEAVDFDYDEPILHLEKIGEILRITIVAYNSTYSSDIYYYKSLLWENVGGIGQAHVGETVEIEANRFGLFTLINIEVRDPGNMARYAENILIT